MNKTQIFIQSSAFDMWANIAADCIETCIINALVERTTCHLMLTGGETAKMLYQMLKQRNVLLDCRINFLLGDERCVESSAPESNYGMIEHTLFGTCIPPTWSIQRINAEEPDSSAVASHYGTLLPRPIDVLLLGMGTDGHIASLFPNKFLLSDKSYGFIVVNECPGVSKRITITPQVIREARSVFLLATGKQKGSILRNMLEMSKPSAEMPVSLVTNATWLLDSDAANELSDFKDQFAAMKNA